MSTGHPAYAIASSVCLKTMYHDRSHITILMAYMQRIRQNRSPGVGLHLQQIVRDRMICTQPGPGTLDWVGISDHDEEVAELEGDSRIILEVRKFHEKRVKSEYEQFDRRKLYYVSYDTASN